MTTTRIAYKSIDLAAPCRIFNGKPKARDVCDVNGVTIVRVLDGPLDTFHIAGPLVVDGLEIEATNVVGGVRKHDGIALRGRKASKGDDE